MDVRLINPFLESVINVYTTMLHVTPHRSGLHMAQGGASPNSLVALIGMDGPAQGAVALHLPQTTALATVNHWLGMSMTEIDATVSDGIAELVNIIAGQAKTSFSEKLGSTVSLGLPSVIHGSDFQVKYPGKATWIEIPFESELGAFSLRVTCVMNEQPAEVN